MSRAQCDPGSTTTKRNKRPGIESDSLSSGRAICNHPDKFEDMSWSRVKNADFLEGILIRLLRTAFQMGQRTRHRLRPQQGRRPSTRRERATHWRDRTKMNGSTTIRPSRAGEDFRPSKQDTYRALLRWHTEVIIPILHREALDDMK